MATGDRDDHRVELNGAVFVKAFCQVDVIKGFRFLDLAGRVMNQYDAQFTEMSVAPDGLRMTGSVDAWDEARASGRQLWVGFTVPPSLDYVREVASSYMRDVSSTFEVTACTRMGYRAQFVMPLEAEKAAYARKLLRLPTVIPTSDVTAFSLNVRYPLREYQVSISLPTVTRAEVAGTTAMMLEGTPSEGIMIDIDFFEEGKSLPILNFPHQMKVASEFLLETVPQIAAALGANDD